jgi:glycosyltransferase involved in cell wall biosynthesis
MVCVRVAMVIPWYLPRIGGAETQCFALCKALGAREDVSVAFLLTRLIETAHARAEEIGGVAVRRFGPVGGGKVGELLSCVNAAARLLRARNQFDVIHCHTTSPLALFAALAARLCGKPVLLKLSTNGDLDSLMSRVAGIAGRAKRWLVRQALAHGIFVALNQDGAGELERHRALRTELVPNGIDTSVFFPPDAGMREALRRESGCSGQFVILFCGRFAKRKGLDLLLEAYRELFRSHGVGLQLWLLGSSKWQEDPADEGTWTGLSSSGIRVIDPVFPAAPYLQAADLFVLPSRREGMPNAALEAGACGLPCLLSDIAPHREFQRDNPDAATHLFRSGDAQDLLRKLEGIVGDLGAVEWARRPASRVSGRFLMERVAERYANIYRRSADGHG